jgi:hypothetical protein
MLDAVGRALDDGLIEHPWHAHEHTLRTMRTMEAVLTRMSPASAAL